VSIPPGGLRGRDVERIDRDRSGGREVILRPMIGAWQVPRIEAIRAHEARRLGALPVPGLSGDLHQDLGKGALTVEIAGSLSGDEARDGFLAELRGKFYAAEPVDFVADIVHESDLEQVLVEAFEVEEVASGADGFRYRLRLKEHTEPPQPVASGLVPPGASYLPRVGLVAGGPVAGPGAFGAPAGAPDLLTEAAAAIEAANALDAALGLDLLDLPAVLGDVPALDELLEPVGAAADLLAKTLARAGEPLAPLTDALTPEPPAEPAQTTLAASQSSLQAAFAELSATLAPETGQGSAAALLAISPAVPAESLAALPTSAAIDLRDAGALAVRLATEIAALVPGLPDPAKAVTAVTAPLELIEAATKSDLAGQVRGLVERLAAELARPGDSGFAAVLARLAETAQQAGEGRALWDVLTSWLRAGGVDPAAVRFPVADAVAAVDAAVRAAGGLMSLETMLARGERLAEVLAAQLDAGGLDARADAVLAQLADGGALPNALAGLDPSDPVQVEQAAQQIHAAAAALDLALGSTAQAMGFGEATLVLLDLPRLRVEVERTAALVRAVDLDPVTRLCAWLGDRLGALLGFDVTVLAERTFAELLDDLEARSAELVATIESAPVEAAAEPVREGVARLLALAAALANAMAEASLALRTALLAIRDAVAQVPVESLAAAIRTALAPAREALDAVANLVEGAGHAVEDAAAQAKQAIAEAQAAIDTFRSEDLKEALAEVAAWIDRLDVDGLAGEVAGEVQSFADELAKTEVGPYFDAAVSGIEAAAAVVERVPFELLPESTRQEVAEAVKPIRDADPDKAEADVRKVFLHDGQTFEDFLEEQVADVQKLYDELVEEAKSLDPRALASELTEDLEALAGAVAEVSPQLTLEPVARAIDAVKEAVAEADPEQLLAPLREAFADLLAAIDAYSADTLVAALEERLGQACEKLMDDLRLRQWQQELDDLVAGLKRLLALLDPARVEEEIRRAFAEVHALIDELPLEPAGGIGAIVAAFLAGTGLPIEPVAFDVVVRWLRGEVTASAALGGRTTRLAAAVERARAGVAAVDPAALARRLRPRVEALGRAIADLPEETRSRLRAAIQRLLPEERLAALAANRDRYLVALAAAAGAAELLARSGLAGADQVVLRLRLTIDPVRALTAFVTRLLTRIGVPGIESGLAGLAHAVVDAAPPERIAAILAPIVAAVHGRAEALLDAVAAPLGEGIAELIAMLESLTLAPLGESLAAVHGEVRARIAELSPDALLADVLASFTALQAEVQGFDPLVEVEGVLTDLRDKTSGLLANLDVEALLAEPIASYERLLSSLGTVDVGALVAPVVERVVALEEEFDEGLNRTIGAFKHLRDALPAKVGS
jgi:hypothetical protein